MKIRSAGFWSVAYCVAAITMTSTIPAPLYPLYRNAFGLSPLMVTVLFAAYVLGVVIVLLLAGNLSDRIGRRPVLLLCMALAITGCFVFLFAESSFFVIVGRIACGMGVGLFNGTATAALLDFEPGGDHRRATTISTTMTVAGQAMGGLVSGMLVGYAPWPLRLVWIVESVLLLGGAFLVWCLPNDRRPWLGGWRLRGATVTGRVRQVAIAAAAAGFCYSAIWGFYSGLSASLLRDVLHIDDAAVSGEVIALLFVVSIVTQFSARRVTSRRASCAGLMTIIAALGILVLAEHERSLSIFIATTVLCGIGQGLAFIGAVGLVTQTAPPPLRSQLISQVFMFSYFGFAVPILGIGALISWLGFLPATEIFSAVIALLSAATVAALLRLDMNAARS